MAATLEKPVLGEGGSDFDDEDTHLVCCLENDKAFCGQDMRGVEWELDQHAIVCHDCDNVFQLDPTGCPFGRTCPE